MNILLTIGNKTALLRSSDTCYELCYKRSQRGVESWTPEKYYSTMASALTAILEKKIRSSTASSLSELKEMILQSQRELVCEYGLNYRIEEDTAR